MKSKVLLMGPGESGKTSMRSIIFANYLARDTQRLGLTIDMERSQVKFLGNMILNLWDCGGQKSFIDTYLKKQRDFIFSNVAVLIYVFDISALSKSSGDEISKTDWDKRAVMEYFQSCVEALSQFSPNAKLFCFLHKVDLISQEMREQVFEMRKQEILEHVDTNALKPVFFATSIWNESLYSAWSKIVNSLIPNVDLLDQFLDAIVEGCDASEVAVFERSTFLCISHKKAKLHNVPEETPTRVSNIVKRFKLSCMREDNQAFTSIDITTPSFIAIIDNFTENTLILMVTHDCSTSLAVHKMNLAVGERRFNEFLCSASPAAAAMKEVL